MSYCCGSVAGARGRGSGGAGRGGAGEPGVDGQDGVLLLGRHPGVGRGGVSAPALLEVPGEAFHGDLLVAQRPGRLAVALAEDELGLGIDLALYVGAYRIL